MKKGKRLLTDTVLGVIGLVFMNGILSLLVYPYLDRALGSDSQGKILFYTSIMNLLAGSFGSAANYIRLKVKSEGEETKNGDYLRYLLLSLLFVIALSLAAFFYKGDTAGSGIVTVIVLIFMTVIRYYADVEFRLSLRYGHFCLYYVAVGAGYLLGTALFPLTKSWAMILLPGELFGLLYVLIFGRILRKKPFETSPNEKKHFGMMAGLTVAYFLSDFVGQSDRLLFPLILPGGGDVMTAMYYRASLVGKTMSLLSTPLNGVLMGHLSNEEGTVSRKNFLKIIGALFLVFFVVTAGATLGSHLFVYWFYPADYETLKPLFLLANAGQVLFFVCNTLMVIVLRYTHPRNQIITSVAYIAAFFMVTVPLILKFELYGMAYGILIVNALKFILFTLLGLFGLNNRKTR